LTVFFFALDGGVLFFELFVVIWSPFINSYGAHNIEAHILTDLNIFIDLSQNDRAD